jgi:hypothetical protein
MSNVSRHQMPPVLIDLRRMRESLAAKIERALRDFSAHHPDVPICTVGIFGDGFHGVASLALDTPDHSAAFVDKWIPSGPDWYGRDECGCYCNNCEDFAYYIDDFTFEGYPDLYEKGEAPVEFITLDGTHHRVHAHDGDEGYDRVFFPFLKEILVEFGSFQALRRATPFRVGVHMHGADIEQFWVVQQ